VTSEAQRSDASASTEGLCDCQHEWEYGYYGDKCKKCGVFYPDASNPWNTVCRHGKDLDDVCLLCYFGADA